MQDRGHVELPAGASERGTSSFDLRAERGSLPGGVAPRPGRIGVARVASPAQVAQVASVARVSRPGSTIGPAFDPVPATPRPIAAPVPDLGTGLSGTINVEVPPTAAVAHAGEQAATQGRPAGATPSPVDVPLEAMGSVPKDAGSSDTDGSGRQSREQPSESETARPAPSITEARQAALDLLSRATDGAIRPAGRVEAPTFVNAMDRVERVLEARELARSAAPSSVRVKLDGTAGPIESIRVGLTGRDVLAELDVSDPATADLLRSRVSELTEALEIRGMELSTMGIRPGGSGEGLVESLLGSRGDATADLLRTLLGGSSTEQGRESRDERFRQQAQRQFNDDRNDSNRSGRDSWKEQRQ